jgi:cysteinyl-tRNA synthetase
VFGLKDGVLDIQPLATRVTVDLSGAHPEVEDLAQLSESDRSSMRWAVERLQARLEARRARDFGTADGIRLEVEAAGFVVKDTGAGTQLERWR